MPNPTMPQSFCKAPKIHLVLDWDGTITTHDTIRVLADIDYQRRQTLLSRGQSQGMIPPWDHFVQSYLKDYREHTLSYKPAKEDRKTIAEESVWLASLGPIEKASVDRVRLAGIFKGLKKDDLERAAKEAIRDHRVELRPGWRDLLFQTGHGQGVDVWISSVNWSGTFIEACIAAALNLEGHNPNIKHSAYRMWSNDLEGLSEASTGIIRSGPECSLPGIHTSADKAQLLRMLRVAGHEALHLSSSDTKHSPIIIYVGDTGPDFDSLVEADIGICIQDQPLSGGQKELQEMFDRLEFRPRDITNQPYDLLEKKERVIWTAKDLKEVSAFIENLKSQVWEGKQPTPSKFPTGYTKHFIPLESDPEIFTELARSLGLSKQWAFHDVLTLDEPDPLAMIPRPVEALILVFPTSENYEKQKEVEESTREDYDGCGKDQRVLWFRQTINNACGLYCLLHAICNASSQDLIVPDSDVSRLLSKVVPLKPLERARVLENDEKLEAAYHAVARKGTSEVPEDPSAEVDYHYICFVKSQQNGHFYELDGDKRGPVDYGLVGQGDLLSDGCLKVVKEFIESNGSSVEFSLIAFAPVE